MLWVLKVQNQGVICAMLHMKSLGEDLDSHLFLRNSLNCGNSLNLCLCLHTAFSPCMSKFTSSYEDTVTGLEIALM